MDHGPMRKFRHTRQAKSLRLQSRLLAKFAQHAHPDAKQTRDHQQHQPRPRSQKHVGWERCLLPEKSDRQIDRDQRHPQNEQAEGVVKE